MTKHQFMRSMGLGIVAGTALGMALAPKQQAMKAAAQKAVRAVEDTAGNISDAIGR